MAAVVSQGAAFSCERGTPDFKHPFEVRSVGIGRESGGTWLSMLTVNVYLVFFAGRKRLYADLC